MLLCNLALKGAEIVIDHLPDYLVVLHPVTKRTIAAKTEASPKQSPRVPLGRVGGLFGLGTWFLYNLIINLAYSSTLYNIKVLLELQ